MKGKMKPKNVVGILIVGVIFMLTATTCIVSADGGFFVPAEL